MASMLFGNNGIFDQSQYNPNAVQAAPGVVPGAGVAGLQSTASLLGQQAMGGGPNLAGAQLQQAQDQSARQALALAASTRANQNPGMALYASQNSLAGNSQANAAAAAQARLAQQMGAENQMGQVYGAIGQQGLAAAQLGQQNNQFNAGAQNAMTQQQNQGIIGASSATEAANQALFDQGAQGVASQLIPGSGSMKGLSAATGLGALALAKGGITDGPTALTGEDGKEAVIPLERGGPMVHVPHSAIQALAAGLADLSARLGKLEGGGKSSESVVKELGKAKGKVLPFKKAA